MNNIFDEMYTIVETVKDLKMACLQKFGEDDVKEIQEIVKKLTNKNSIVNLLVTLSELGHTHDIKSLIIDDDIDKDYIDMVNLAVSPIGLDENDYFNLMKDADRLKITLWDFFDYVVKMIALCDEFNKLVKDNIRKEFEADAKKLYQEMIDLRMRSDNFVVYHMMVTKMINVSDLTIDELDELFPLEKEKNYIKLCRDQFDNVFNKTCEKYKVDKKRIIII